MLTRIEDRRALAFADRLVARLTDVSRRERSVIAVLLVYVGLWTLYGLFAKASQDVNYDSAELVAWSRELALGYPKHPPLATWLVRAWFTLFPIADWAFYLLAMVSAALGLWIAWLLMARFLDAEKRVVGLALLTLIPFYNFHALKFDHNMILIPLWATTTLCFLRSVETRSSGWAALAGACAAAAMLGKYWSIFLLAGLGLAALIDPRRRIYFRSRAPWITVVIGALMLTPHVVWLVGETFSPLNYAIGTHGTESTMAVAYAMISYLVGGAGYGAVPILLVLTAFRPSRAILVDMVWPQEPERRFVAIAYWAPILLPGPIAFLIGIKLNPIWIMSCLTLLPVMLLSSPLVSISHQAVIRIVGFAAVLPAAMVAMAPAIAFVIHHRGVHPGSAHGSLLVERMVQEWRKTTDRPLRLVGGDLDLAYVAAFYTTDHPSALPVEEPEVAPWVDASRIKRQGIAIACHAYNHPTGYICMHEKVLEAIERIVAGAPSVRRVEVTLARTFFGVVGKAGHYIIFIVPPRPE